MGWAGGRPYAFAGLERDSGPVVLDLSNPSSPVLVGYFTNRTFPQNAGGAYLSCASHDCGDLGPEGLTFVPADRPTGKPLLIVSNEGSRTTTVWQVD